MPMDRKRYPPDWARIATEVKEAADWKCQNCGKQCRRPGEPFDTHKRTLTVAHLNHTPEDVRTENLQALCAPCHLRYDAQHHAETRRKKAMKPQEDKYIRLADAVDAVEQANGNMTWADRGNCKKRLEDLSPADVAPVRHAHWRDTDNYYRRWRCSACSGHTKEAHPPVCPFCGAKMDGKGEE